MKPRLLLSALAIFALIGGAYALSSTQSLPGSSTLLQASERPTQQEANQIPLVFSGAWSSPSIESLHSVQFRKRFDIQGPFDFNPDVVFRFEPLPSPTIARLQSQFPNIVIEPLPITGAMIVRDVKNMAGEQVYFPGTQLPDGTWEVRVPPPPGGWTNQVMTTRILASSGSKLILDRESQFVVLD